MKFSYCLPQLNTEPNDVINIYIQNSGGNPLSSEADLSAYIQTATSQVFSKYELFFQRFLTHIS